MTRSDAMEKAGDLLTRAQNIAGTETGLQVATVAMALVAYAKERRESFKEVK